MSYPNTLTQRVSKRVGFYRDAADSWKVDHEIAISCFDIQQMLIDGNQLFEFIIQFDEGFQSLVFETPALYSEEARRQIDDGMQIWLDSSRKFIAYAMRFEDEFRIRGFDVQHIQEMKKNVAQMEMMLADQTEFFSRGNLDALRDAAIEEHRSGLTKEM